MDATIKSNAWNLLSATESGRWNYTSLVDEYQGLDHLHQDAGTAQSGLAKPVYNRHSCFSAEKFLASSNDYVSCIRKGLLRGETYLESLQPAKFLDALHHPSYANWKEIHNEKDWTDLRREVIKKAHDLMEVGSSCYIP